MAETIIMRGAYAITDPRVREAGVISDGAVAITDGIVVETGLFAELAPKYPGAQVIGDGTQLLLPGLVDAQPWARAIADPERRAQRFSRKRPVRLGLHACPAP